MIQFEIPFSLKEKTPFQPLSETLVTEEDLIDLILEYNYRRNNNELDNALYPVSYKRLKDNSEELRKVRIEWLVERIQKYNPRLFSKYDLLLIA